MRTNKTLNLTYNSIFIVIAIILGYIGRLSFLPIFPFLKLDFSDIPVFLATLILGIPSGITVLLISSAFRAFMFSSAGILGFIMRLTSLIMILFIGFFSKLKINKFYKILGVGTGTLVCLFIKLIINYYVWINFFYISPLLLKKIMFTIIVPYNLLKLLITVGASYALAKYVKQIMQLSKN